MSRLVRSFLVPLVVLLGASLGSAQTPPEVDPPARHVPTRAATRQELDHLEALKLYGLGVIQERGNRLVEALHTFEEARRLDAEAVAIPRTLIPLYLALDRTEDALGACRRVLELDPDDYDTGYRYARQLRSLGQRKEAQAILERTGRCPGLKDRLDIRAQVFFDLGVLYEEASNWEKAEKSFREVTAILDNPAAMLEQGPYNRDEITGQAAETYERIGRICLKAQQPTRAVEAFQKALTKDPQRAARLSYNLAEVYVRQGEPTQALAQIEQYLQAQPQSMDGYELRITLQKQLNRAGDILPALERSALADRNNAALKLLLAREYRRAGRIGSAEEIYTNLLRDTPTPDVYRGLFDLYRADPRAGAERILARLNQALERATGKDKKLAESEATHARAMLLVLRDDPELVKQLLPPAQRRLAVGAGLAHATRILLANLAARTNQLEAAEGLYRSCLGAPGARENEHEVYHGLLRVLSLGHKHQAILDLCSEGLKHAQNTNRVLFLLEMAQSHMALGHVRESLAAADDAVHTAGDADTALRCRLVRAEMFLQAEQPEQAIAECQALLKEYNQAGAVRDIRATLSAICSAAHQYERAEEQLQLILKEDPNDATANNDLGYLWADQNKNLDEAEKLVRKALELDAQQRKAGSGVSLDSDRDNAAYVDSLGWVLFRKGDLATARRELERAVKLSGGNDDPVVLDHLGDVCFRLKETERAGQVWKKALQLYDAGVRRRTDDRYREIKAKLELLGP
jgi:tetratricopeptide (TPR) repeat protein